MRSLIAPLCVAFLGGVSPAHAQQQRCDIPHEARDIWHCENGFVIGPENVIIRLPIPETDPEALYRAGVEAANRQDWRVAIAYLTVAHDMAPFESRYMYNLGLAHARAGHDVAAIASFAQYLIAEPSTANRRAVWAQIAELESAAQRSVDQIFSSARTAVEAVPEVSPDVSSGLDARSQVRQSLQIQMAMAGRVSQADELNIAHSRLSTSVLQDWYLRTLVDDGDAGSVRATPEPSERGVYPYQLYLDRASRDLRVEDNVSIPISGIEPWELLASFLRHDAGSPAPTVESLRTNVARLEGQTPQTSLFPLLDVTNDGLQALLAGDLDLARRASRLAEAYDEALTRCGASCASITQGGRTIGWHSAFLRACLRAEQGDVAGALSGLDAFSSARLGSENWPFRARLESGVVGSQAETAAPDRRWREARWSARYSLALFLAFRGRPREAEQLVASLNPLVRAQFYSKLLSYGVSSLAPNWDAAAIGQLHDAALNSGNVAPERRQSLERLEYFRVNYAADGLADIAYDPDWWVRHVSRASDPVRQSRDLSAGAVGLARSLRRIHVAYGLAGGTWGQ